MKQSEHPEVTSVERYTARESSPPSAQGSPWAWLTAMSRSLGFVAEILDADDAPMRSFGHGPAAVTLRHALSDPKSAVRGAAKAARTAIHGIAESGSPFRTLCYRLFSHGASTGVLVLAHDGSDPALPSRDGERALEQVGPWLAKAVEAQLARPNDGEDDDEQSDDAELESADVSFDRVSSLHRRLTDAIGQGGEAEMVSAFAEALFAWDGIEVVGYVDDLQGRLMPLVMTPGATRGHAHVALDPGVAPRTPMLNELAAGVLDALGRPRARRTFGIEIATPVLDPWVLVCAEGFAPLDPDRLSLYVGVLRDALVRTATIAETRTTWSVLQPLLAPSGPTDVVLSAAIHELARHLKGSSAAISVVSSGGATVLTAGDTDATTTESPFARHHRLVSTTPVGDRYTLVLTVHRGVAQPFARREQLALDRAAGIFAAWLPGRLPAALRQQERRAESRDFEVVLERAARQAVRDGVNTSVLVMALDDGSPGPDTLHRWIADIRGQLRGSDLAGMLSDREIGVLLSGTPTHEITTVSSRLERCLTTERGRVPLTIGATSRDGGSRSDEPMVRMARRNAASRIGAVRELRRPQ